MKTNVNTVPTVNVNGREVLDFTPDYTTQSAIVSLNVIQRLAGLLPVNTIENITKDLRYELGNITNINDYLKLLQDELDFHSTVNLLTMYESNKDTEIEEALGRY